MNWFKVHDLWLTKTEDLSSLRDSDGYSGFSLFCLQEIGGIFVFEDGCTFVKVRWWW